MIFGDPKLRAFSLQFFFWNGITICFWICSGSFPCFKKFSNIKINLLSSNLWTKIFRTFPYFQHVHSLCLPAFLKNCMTNLYSLKPRHYKLKIKSNPLLSYFSKHFQLVDKKIPAKCCWDNSASFQLLSQSVGSLA